MSKQPKAQVVSLPKRFREEGFDLQQVKRTSAYAIYVKSKPRQSSFEVVRIMRRDAEDIKGTPFPAREIYPRSSDWGIDARTYQNRTDAEKAFTKLTKKGHF